MLMGALQGSSFDGPHDIVSQSGTPVLSCQARAHALLKAKEVELGKAREEAHTELAADLARAYDETAAAIAELKRVCTTPRVLLLYPVAACVCLSRQALQTLMHGLVLGRWDLSVSLKSLPPGAAKRGSVREPG